MPLGYRPRTPYNSSGNALAAIQSNGVNLGGTSKFMDEAQVSGHGVVTEFDLFINSNGEAENGFDVTVESCVISFANAVNLPFTFSGKLSHVIQGTRWGIFRVRSDVLGISVPKGQVYSILTRVSVASGSKYPITIIARRGNYEEGWSADPAVAGPGPDLTPFGTAWAPVAGVTRIFAPSVILTRPDTRTLSIMFLTDSIGVGTGESIVPNNSRWDEGWCTRAVRNKWPHFVLGLSGVTIAKWINPVTNPQASIRRRTVMENIHHTDVVVQQGVNDFQGGATTAQAQVLALSQWKDLAKYGKRIHQSTITPAVIASTDFYTTVAGQTANSVAPQIAAFNDWLRDGAPFDTATGLAVAVGATGATIVRAARYYTTVAGVAQKTEFTTVKGHPLTAIFEVADAIETARNSGIVKAVAGARIVGDGAMTSGQATLTSAAAAFSASDVGRLVRVFGVGASGVPLATHIVSVAGGVATLAAAASTTASAQQVYISPYGMMADGVHPSGTAGPNAGGHETMAAFVQPQFVAEFGADVA